MRNHEIVPCIWLDDQAEQAAALYTRTFPGSRIGATSRYPESADNPGGRPRGSVLTVEAELAGRRQIPIYRLDGRMVLYFAGFQRHYSIYPATERVVGPLEGELAGLLHSKATIRFPYDAAVPARLITRIARLRADEVSERGTARAAAARPASRKAKPRAPRKPATKGRKRR
ncbi:MAG TPA: VOC family protein [Anaeromyxobacter sp.]|nr:VOC family protein [Anaeromyxobacter sp.]